MSKEGKEVHYFDRKVAGPINLSKEEEEGYWAMLQTIWGIVMNTEELRASLPAVKLQKAAHILQDPALDPGFEELRLLTLQVLRGNLQYWTYVLPCLRAGLGTVDKLLGLCRPGDPMLHPRDSSNEAEVAYESLEETVELLRLLVSQPDRWDSVFTNSFMGMLSIPEQLAYSITSASSY